MYNQRQIVLIPFPYTNLTGNKLRPALIISNNDFNKSGDRLCTLVTSNESNFSIKINEKDQIKNKLPFESFVKPHRLFTVDKKIIQKSLCVVSETFHKKIIKEVNKIID